MSLDDVYKHYGTETAQSGREIINLSFNVILEFQVWEPVVQKLHVKYSLNNQNVLDLNSSVSSSF